MHHDFAILYDLFIVFLCATIVVIIFQRFKIPHIAGFLLSGVLAGPFGLNLITQRSEIDTLAEIGVALLLFMIGLEFSLAELRRIKRDVILGGGLQVILTALAAFFVARFFGMDLPKAIFVSQLIALSSTAVVLGYLTSHKEIDTPHGRVILGILLFQDLCVVPMMLMTPLLGSGNLELVPLLLSFGKSMLLVAAILVSAVFVVPRILEVVVRVRLREILVLGVVVMAIGIAWATSSLGVSLALGAFIAGLAISESPYSHQVAAEILPFKDVFYSLFFISMGMLLDLTFLFDHLLVLLAFVLATLIIKALLAGSVARLMTGSNRLAVIVGLGIAGIGEFSFILGKLGLEHNLLDAVLYQGLLAVAVVTMILTPFILNAAPAIGNLMPHALPKKLLKTQQQTQGDALGKLKDHTIIVGFGPNGRYLARVLKESDIPYCILEVNAQTVREAKQDGEPIWYGDATRLNILEFAGLSRARVLVITSAELETIRRIIAVAKHHSPDLHVITRTKFSASVKELYEIGATLVIAEEFETAIEIFAHVLAEYDLPRNVINAFIEVIRREGSPLARTPGTPLVSMDRLRRLLAGNIVENFLLLEDSPAIGKSLMQLEIRKRTGATVLVVVRNDRPHVNPSGEFLLEEGDLLVLLGSHFAIQKAIDLLIATD